MITSRVDELKLKGDYKVKNWKPAGLLFPSLIRFSKIATVELNLVDKVIGHLNTIDSKGAKTAFRNHFNHWIEK